MVRKALYRIVSILVGVSIILAILMASTEMPNEKDNGFIRSWVDNEPELIGQYSTNLPLKRIVGFTNNTIFLVGDSYKGVLFLSKDFKRRDTLLLNYTLPPEKMTPFSLYIDTPMLYLHVNNMQTVLRGEFPGKDMELINLNSMVFFKSIQISRNSIVIREMDSLLRNQNLKKLSLDSVGILAMSNISELRDSTVGISTDGNLLYNKESGRIFYLESFRNRLYCLDTNLNLLYNSHTIDTFSTNKIELTIQRVDDSTRKLAPSRARMQVNEKLFSNSKFLFVISAVRSDNENLKDFNRSYTFDMYLIENGTYVKSFRVEKEENNILESVAIFNDTLAVLKEKTLEYYKMPVSIK